MRTLFLLIWIIPISPLSAQIFTKISLPPFSSDLGDTRGVAWGDADGDGDPDLIMTNQSSQANFFYLNNSGTFVKNTISPIAQLTTDTGGSFWADVDNDGDEDFLAYDVNSGNQRLYLNNGNLSFSLAPGSVSNSVGPSRGGSWADYNNDGFIDLFIPRENNSNNLLFFNNGNGTFTQITSGILVTDGGRSRGSAWCDYDLDGDMDLVVPNYLQSNSLYRNDGTGTFTKILNSPISTATNSSFGASWGDLNNDGYPDLYITNFKDPNEVYLNNGNGTFTQIQNTNINITSTNTNSAALGDIDNDGDLDILAISGEVSCPTGDCTNDIFLNTGNGALFSTVPVTEPFTIDDDPSQGVALADYDRDGYLDAAVSNRDNFANYLFQNNGGSNHWVQVKLQGIASNRQGIGARLEVLSAGKWQSRQMLANSGYRGQSELIAHFGLGPQTTVDSLIVSWPSGEICTFTSLIGDSLYTFVEGCSDCDSLTNLSFLATEPICNGEANGSLLIQGIPSTGSYLYRLDSGLYQPSLNFSNLIAGTYQVGIVNDTGCTYTISATISQPDSIQLVLGSQPSLAGGSTGSAWVNASGGIPPYNYQWSTGASTDSITGVASGWYIVTVVDSLGCTILDSIFVDKACSGDLTSVFDPILQPRCPEDSTGSILAIGQNGIAPYQYALNNGTYTSSGSFQNLQSGSYSLTILDSDGCTFDTTFTILAPPIPISVSFLVTGETAFGANDGSIMIQASGGSGSPFQFAWSNGSTGDSLGNLVPGVYNVTVTDSRGCSVSDSATVPGAAVSIGEPLNLLSWTLSPNPTSGEFLVTWEKGIRTSLEVYDYYGKLVYSATSSSGEEQISFPHGTSKGVYLILMKTEERVLAKSLLFR